MENYEWMQKNIKACPQCKVSIHKDGGCYHMQCSGCKHEFCWKCLNPHDHTMNHPCGLWENEEQMIQAQKICDICFENKNNGEFKQLSCCAYDASCNNCLLDLIKTSLQEKTTINILCPNRTCAQPMILQDIQAINLNAYELFCEVAAYECINNEKHIKQCPMPDCSYLFINDEKLQQSFTCPQCKHIYCSSCLMQHAPEMTCEQAKRERELTENPDLANQASQEWIAANTKECPACHKLIQKNGGCNHMTCKQCLHEFCWTCGATYRTTRCDSVDCEAINPPINQLVGQIQPRARNQQAQPRIANILEELALADVGVADILDDAWIANMEGRLGRAPVPDDAQLV